MKRKLIQTIFAITIGIVLVGCGPKTGEAPLYPEDVVDETGMDDSVHDNLYEDLEEIPEVDAQNRSVSPNSSDFEEEPVVEDIPEESLEEIPEEIPAVELS